MRSEYVKKVWVTEKALFLKKKFNIYVFKVPVSVDKNDFASYFSSFFKLKIKKIRSLVVRGKMRRGVDRFFKAPNFKKLYVVLESGQDFGSLQEVCGYE